MNVENLIIEGIGNIVYRAKIFLNEIGEFAPFGIMYEDNKWIDIATFEKNMDSVMMKDFLLSTINIDFQKGVCLFGAVCVDANVEGIGNAIIIYNSSDGIDWYELIYRYFTNEEGEIIIEEKNVE